MKCVHKLKYLIYKCKIKYEQWINSYQIENA